MIMDKLFMKKTGPGRNGHGKKGTKQSTLINIDQDAEQIEQ